LLPSEFKEALSALKDQVKAVNDAILTKASNKPEALIAAQKRMQERSREIRIIASLILATNKGKALEDCMSIATLTEVQLRDLLSKAGLIESNPIEPALED